MNYTSIKLGRKELRLMEWKISRKPNRFENITKKFQKMNTSTMKLSTIELSWNFDYAILF